MARYEPEDQDTTNRIGPLRPIRNRFRDVARVLVENIPTGKRPREEDT